MLRARVMLVHFYTNMINLWLSRQGKLQFKIPLSTIAGCWTPVNYKQGEISLSLGHRQSNTILYHHKYLMERKLLEKKVKFLEMM